MARFNKMFEVKREMTDAGKLRKDSYKNNNKLTPEQYAFALKHIEEEEKRDWGNSEPDLNKEDIEENIIQDDDIEPFRTNVYNKGDNNMAHIRDIDIDRLNIDESLKPYIAEALIQLDDLFDEKGWDKFLSPKQIERLYDYTISEFAEGDIDKNEGGTVSYDEKTVKVNDVKNIATLKHELLHAIKGEKEVSGVKTQGVKQIYNSKDKGIETSGRATEEYLNEMMVGEDGDIAYRDGTQVAKLMHAVMGDDVVEASLKGDRNQFEDAFYDKTGSDDFLKTFEDRLELINTMNVPENEVYMLSPVVSLIELHETTRAQELSNPNLTRDDALKMLAKDEEIREAIKGLGFDNLSSICMDIFDKRMSDLYKSDAIYELDVSVSNEFEKSMKLIDKRNLSHVDNEYIDGALNGGDTLRKTYENKIRQSIENGEFTNDEEGLRKYVETIQHYQKNIAIPVEDNKQKQELQEMGLPTYDMNPDLSEQTAFANDQFTDFNKMISMQMLGRVDEDFINFLGSANIISNTDISKENREQYIEHFSEGIIGQEEHEQTIAGDMTVEQLFNQYGLENVKMEDLKKALEDIKQRQQPMQERVNPLANEEKNNEGR